MTSIRNLFLIVAAMTLAAFALPSTAADKTFKIAVTPSPILATTTTVNVVFTNTGTSSNFNSIVLSWSAGSNFTVTSAKQSQAPGTVVPIAAGETSVTFTNLSPVKQNKTVTVTLGVTVGVTCGTPSVTWTPQAFTGSPSQPSTVFTAVPTTTTTNITGAACTFGFVTQPADAFASTNTTTSNITTQPFNSAGAKVRVKLLLNGSAPNPAVTPTVSSSCATSASASPTDANSGESELTLTAISAAASHCTITASAMGGSATSNEFTIQAPLGILGCDSTDNFAGNPVYDPDGIGPFMGTPGFALRRYDNRTPDANNSYCPYQIPYTFTFDPDGSASFVADKLGQDIIVEYVLVLNPRATVAGWPVDVHPWFSWGIANPVFTGDYHLGQACNNDDPANAKNVSPMPGAEQMCAAQLGWTGVSPGFVQNWIKIIDIDGFTKMP